MRKLTKKQLILLELALNFRFVTAPIMAEKLNLKSRQSMVTTLNRLVSSGLLNVRKSDNKDFSNRGNSYYITADGYRALTDNPRKEILKSISRSKTVTRKFVNHSTDNFRILVHLIRFKEVFDKYCTYLKMINILDDEDLIPKPMPDLLLATKGNERYLFVESVHDEHLFIAKKKIRNYIDFLDLWYLDERLDILFILGKKSDETSLLKYIQEKIEGSLINKHTFFTTTLDRLTSDDRKNIFYAIDARNEDEIIKNCSLDPTHAER